MSTAIWACWSIIDGWLLPPVVSPHICLLLLGEDCKLAVAYKKNIYIQLVCTVGTYCTAKTIGVVLTSLNIHKEYSGSSWICVGFWFLCFPLPVIIPPLLSTLMSLHTAVYSNVLQAKLLCFCSLYGESECAYFSQYCSNGTKWNVICLVRKGGQER
jgi:hypothetical protein